MVKLLHMVIAICLGFMVCVIAWMVWPFVLFHDANLAALVLIPCYGIYRLGEWMYNRRKKS